MNTSTVNISASRGEPLAHEQAPRTQRRYDIDALRTLAFMLLILYHAGMFYVADWGFHIKSNYLSETLKFPMILVNQWRMPLLFLVSGIASSFLLRKIGAKNFVLNRTLKLWIPFTVGVILIIPPQAYLEAKANGTLDTHFGGMSYLEFLWHYFSFQGWPEGAFDGSAYGFTWNHLWFIPYLLTYTLFLIPVQVILKKLNVEKLIGTIGVLGLIFIPTTIQIIWKIITDDEVITHAFFNDGFAHGIYFTFFVLGYLISDKENIWKTIVKLRWFSLGAGVVIYCSLISLWWLFNQTQWQGHLAVITATFNQWFWLLAVLGWSATLLNRPYGWIKYANDRVYPWYIFHQTFTIVAGFYLSKLALGGFVESSLVILLTVLGCWLSTLIIQQNSFLKIAFGMK